MDHRDSLISNRMTHADAKETQQKVTSFMDLVNSRTNLDLVVRDEEGNVLSALRYVSSIRNHIKKFKGCLELKFEKFVKSEFVLTETPLSKCIASIRKVPKMSTNSKA